MPSICLLIPVYNNQPGLMRSLASLAADSTDFDVLVVDDGSRPALMLPPHAAGSHRVQLIRKPDNTGIAAALNSGLRQALRGGYEFIARLDAGDVVLPGRLRRQREFLLHKPDCALVSSFVDFVDGRGTRLFRYTAPVDHAGILRRMRLNNCIVHAGVMLRSAVFCELGLYNEAAVMTEDYELFLRVADRWRLAVIPEVLTRCEYNPNGLSVARRKRHQIERLKLQLAHFSWTWLESYYGVLRTCVALATPQWIVLKCKRALQQ